MNHIHERETIKTKKFIKKKQLRELGVFIVKKRKLKRRKEKDIMAIF